jgi:LAO/AO transport system kinase
VTDTPTLAAAIRSGDRKALAQGITLVESQRADDEPAAEALLHALLPHAGNSLRLGITGAPGVGKSTLIEALGNRLVAAGKQVAVLAVDPSSVRTGGSILGDKTRMAELSRSPRAFIRPSPGGDAQGGVAARTREAMLLCEAAGHDVVLVETIGTGQSEVAVEGMVDYFLLLLSPAAGDELQGIKRGVMELCDGVLVHKADGDLLGAAQRTAQQCQLALRVLRSGEAQKPVVVVGSSLTGAGLDELWRAIASELAAAAASGALQARRSQQVDAWLDDAVRQRLLAAFFADPRAGRQLAELRQQVRAGTLLAPAAARQLLSLRR